MNIEERLEMRDKYPDAADLLETTIKIISIMLNRVPLGGPPHDIAGWILQEYFQDKEVERPK